MFQSARSFDSEDIPVCVAKFSRGLALYPSQTSDVGELNSGLDRGRTAFIHAFAPTYSYSLKTCFSTRSRYIGPIRTTSSFFSRYTTHHHVFHERSAQPFSPCYFPWCPFGSFYFTRTTGRFSSGGESIISCCPRVHAFHAPLWYEFYF